MKNKLCSHRIFNRKGQAVAEMAIFGSLVLLLFGSLLSYGQRYNDQQYVQMEAFRRALKKANDGLGTEGSGAGASARYQLIENRRHADLSGNFRKGSAQSFSSSSNVFWAVPSMGQRAGNLNVYKINEDEKQVNYRDYVPEEQDETRSFQTEELSTNSDLSFRETVIKDETPPKIINNEEIPAKITNSNVSQLQETIITTIPYTVKEKGSDNIIEEGVFWAPVQGLYRDTDGQYKYRESTAGTVVERAKTWRTEF